MAKEPATPRVPTSEAPLKSGDVVVIDQSQKGVALAEAGEFEGFSGDGFENVGLRDVLIPRLAILQKLSPQLSSRKVEHIPGAKEGEIADVGMGQTFPQGVLFVPVHYSKVWIEWYPRTTGKGIAAIHGDESIIKSCSIDNERRIPTTSTGNTVLETAQWYGLNLTAGGRKTYIGMAMTQLKASRKWMATATAERLPRKDGGTFQAPLFYRSYFLTTALATKDDNEWFIFRTEKGPSLPELAKEENGGFDWHAIRDDVMTFRRAVIEGDLKADTSSMQDDPDATVTTVDGERAM